MADAIIGQAKVCTKCRESKPATLAEFPPHSMGRFGLHPNCRRCKKQYDAEARARPRNAARQQAWRDANKVRVKAYNDKYRVEHKSTAGVARWRAKNLAHARREEARRMRERRLSDPCLALKERLSKRINQMVHNKAGVAAERLVGFTSAQLKAHIERQFTRGMSWAALLRGEIHIDHIIPVAAFNIDSVHDPDFRVCWGLPNLRPMWARENMAKGSKRITLL